MKSLTATGGHRPGQIWGDSALVSGHPEVPGAARGGADIRGPGLPGSRLLTEAMGPVPATRTPGVPQHPRNEA